jgi:hypothetical protein
MKYIVFPDLTTFAFSVLVVLALATPYLLVQYVIRHRNVNR